MSTIYHVVVQEEPKHIEWLAQKKYNLAIAKSVVEKGGQATSNTIFKSLDLLAPTMDIA